MSSPDDGDSVVISIVVVSYRTPDLLAQCLGMLNSLTMPFQLIVIDNASDDESVSVARCRSPHATLIVNEQNVGFARAVNQALSVATGEYTLLLNPDTSFPLAAIERLIDTLDSSPGVAAVGPAIDHPAGRYRTLSGGRQPTVWRLITQASGLSRLSKRHPYLEGFQLVSGIHDDRPRDVEWLSGACMLVRTSVLTDLGGLTQRWFMYAEDLEFSLRLRRAGWRLVHEPAARISHHVAASSAGAGRTTWATTLADYHRVELARGGTHHAIWRAVFAAMLASRAALYKARALVTKGATRELWEREASVFAKCARLVAAGRSDRS